MSRGIKTLIALGIVALAGLPGAALAAPAQAQNVTVVGTLSGVAAGAAITVTTPANTQVTIATGPHTRYLAYTGAASRAGFKTGEQVAVFTTGTKTGSLAVTVEYSLTPFGVVTRLGGTITSAAANSLTLSTAANATVAVTTTNKTRYSLDGRGLKAVAAIPTNEPALITGLHMTTGETVARFVGLDLPLKRAQRVVLHGTIGTQGPTTLAVTTRSNRPLQVAISAGTLYVVDGTLVASVPTISSAEKVDIVATRGTGGTYTASSVWVKTH